MPTNGIMQNISTAYHPRTDGQSERSNQWLEQYLWFWVDHQQTNWHHYLPLAKFAHNSWKNKTMGQTPYEVLMGYTPRAEIFDVTSSVPTVALHLQDWKRAREEVQKLMIKGQKEMGAKEDLGMYVQRRRLSMARRAQSTSRPSISQIIPKMTQTLQN